MNAQILLFDQMYRASEDPWGYRVRWYEQRKRDLVMACLSRKDYTRALEVGCGNGETTVALAPRCQNLLALDASQAAIDFARRKMGMHPQVKLRQAVIPDQWPDGRYDLVVISEMAYYLEPAELDQMLDRLFASLTESGEAVFCHWRHDIKGCSLNGDEVHRRIAARLDTTDLHQSTQHLETDFRLDVYSRDPYSIAQREGLV